MKFRLFTALLIAFLPVLIHAQDVSESLAPLTVRKIMRDPAWIGHSPDSPEWSPDSKKLYFNWNPENRQVDSLYWIPVKGGKPEKVDRAERLARPPGWGQSWSRDRSKFLYVRHGDIYLSDMHTCNEHKLTVTSQRESNPKFTHDEDAVIYRMDNNLYRLDLSGGNIRQLTYFISGKGSGNSEKILNDQEQYLSDEAFALSEVLTQRKMVRETSKASQKAEKPKEPSTISLGKKRLVTIQLAPDNRYVIFTTMSVVKGNRRTIVPDYVTESGFVEDLNAYAYVGAMQGKQELGIIDLAQDTVYYADPGTISGITDLPAYLDSNAESDSTVQDENNSGNRPLNYGEPMWSADGKYCVLSISSQDHKDRWIMQLHPETAQLTLIDRQHDDAWIGGPGIRGRRSNVGFMPDNQSVWFQSEITGYSHLYSVNIRSGEKTTLTTGEFEVYQPEISKDKRFWYFTANKVNPGVRHFYRMPVNGGVLTQITSLHGGYKICMSPDEKTLAYLYSSANHPWELYIQRNSPGAKPRRITHSLTEEFETYDWKKPEFITFEARDGVNVHARLYRPANKTTSGPGVIFVHGAGYLQNAHQWWSGYFREYMFHNMLADRGYTVLDIDYRGSAGYGRDCRTAIYRSMGGKDLSDQVDGAEYLINECGVNPEKIGIYGGSYGGFITLMAMFKESDKFAAGAALRSVTDWAHYHHWYTSPILNTPVADSIAYNRSSPIYFAEGLKGALLMCHGMIDTNVHFQDIVRLSQRLIELGKTDWELAVYPIEGHGFREASSWTDEYRRIFELFEKNLR
ncbi:S9 family peptidase [bacterium]|nr:S9 family peptidase [bacterium]